MFVHEGNLKNKIASDYRMLSTPLRNFYDDEYLPTKSRLMQLNFFDKKPENFTIATDIFNLYYNKLHEFSKQYNISSQSKFESSFLEEISVYLFYKLPQIQNHCLGIYNKRIFAGLRFKEGINIDIITKDVDFCIGRQINIQIDGGTLKTLVVPVVAVEVKTFLDATMFGEVKSSSKAIRNATPNARTYDLMAYRDLKDKHISAARTEAALNEMFALRQKANMPMEASVIADYWHEIVEAVNATSISTLVPQWGKLLNI